jgi:hypothetical protein
MGFGFYTGADVGYGERPNEVYRSTDFACRRILQLVEFHTAGRDHYAMHMSDLRALKRVSQVDLSAQLGVKQGSISKFEHRTDMKIGTLIEYIKAIGGELELRAHFKEFDASVFANQGKPTEISTQAIRDSASTGKSVRPVAHQSIDRRMERAAASSTAPGHHRRDEVVVDNMWVEGKLYSLVYASNTKKVYLEGELKTNVKFLVAGGKRWALRKQERSARYEIVGMTIAVADRLIDKHSAEKTSAWTE